MDRQTDPRCPKVLSHAVHEFNNAIGPGVGFLRMVLKEQLGPLTDKQRHILEEFVQKSFGRLTGLVAEMSELARLEAGKFVFTWQPTDARGAIRTAAAELPPLPDHDIAIDLQLADGPAMVNADPKRLVQAFTSLLAALRHEIVDEQPLIVSEPPGGGGFFQVHIGNSEARAALASAGERLEFYEWRGKAGLSLTIARRLIELHGGRIDAPPGDRVDKAGDGILEPRGAQMAGVAVTLPLS